MNKLSRTFVAALALAATFTVAAHADVEIGKPAPDFTLKGSDGKSYHLADYKGKIVVLEWYNRDCPFIVKHYSGGNMQKLQEEYGKKGVVWFEVASSAPGKEGYLTAEETQQTRVQNGSKADATLLDPDGTVGKAYKAKTTPHMFIIDAKGVLVYNGAIDDHNTPYKDDIPKSKNYVSAALDEVIAGKPVTNSLTRPYGCGVKYK